MEIISKAIVDGSMQALFEEKTTVTTSGKTDAIKADGRRYRVVKTQEPGKGKHSKAKEQRAKSKRRKARART